MCASYRRLCAQESFCQRDAVLRRALQQCPKARRANEAQRGVGTLGYPVRQLVFAWPVFGSQWVGYWKSKTRRLGLYIYAKHSLRLRRGSVFLPEGYEKSFLFFPGFSTDLCTEEHRMLPNCAGSQNSSKT